MALDPVLEIRGLRKTYRDLRGRRTVALDGIDLDIAGAGVHCLLGPNGSGKTTVIRCALGLVRASAGTIRVCGADVERLATVAHRIGALVEGPRFTPTMSGRLNLELFAAMGGVSDSRIDEVLELVDLADRAGDPVASYSLGMTQRLGIAAALLRDPQFVVLDEPTNGLDPAGIADVRQLVRRLADEGRSVLLASHQLHEVQQICDRAVVLRRGRVIASGTIAELIGRNTAHRVVVTIDERTEAEAVLARAGVHSMPSLEPRQLVVQLRSELTGEDISGRDVNRMLATNNLFADEIRADAISLEDAFLHLTDDEQSSLSPLSPSSEPQS